MNVMRYLNMKRVLYTLLFIIMIQSEVYSQEYTAPMTYSKEINKAYQELLLSSFRKASVDTLDLPFFDDFSYNDKYPDKYRWADNKVFINNNFGKEPPSKGVATFDGFNEKGEPYVVSEFAFGVCDTLTSLPINLNFPASDSIYLSFFIQPQGYGRIPSTNDSLILEFINLNTGKFVKIKSWPGKKSYAFTQVMIPITDTLFLKRGFQFRFKNKGSQYGADDHWHIDYVRLDRARSINDTALQDVSINSNATSLLNAYTAIPWNQYDPSLLAENHFVNIKNNFNTNTNVDFTFSSYLGSTKLDSVTKGLFINSNITSEEESKKVLIPIQPGPFSVVTTYTASTNNDFIDLNDTLKSLQMFGDYFAYDDGTAEDGYGLSVNGSNGRFAYEFSTRNPDTLTHVQFHFTQKQVPIQNEIFTITIWKSINPEVILYQKTSQSPTYIDSLNGFTTYALDSVLIINGGFFIGWVQATNFFMNIGLDRNTINDKFMNYRVNSLGWQKSSIGGSAMIRPVFADNLTTGINTKNKTKNEFILYPNPGNGKFNIKPSNDIRYTIYDIRISNLQGQIINTTTDLNNIDLSNLPKGMYIVQLIGENNEVIGSQKYLKNE